MAKLLSHRRHPPTIDTDKQASLTTFHLASIPGLYSYMRAPPFQETWNVTLGGSAQVLRGEKISARASPLTDRSSMRLPKRQAKKSPDNVEAFRFRLRATLRSLPIRDVALARQCSTGSDTRHHGSKITMLAPDNPKRAIRLPPDRILRQSSNPRLVLVAFG